MAQDTTYENVKSDTDSSQKPRGPWWARLGSFAFHQLLALATPHYSNQGGRPCGAVRVDNDKLLWWRRGAGDAASPAFGSGIDYFGSGRAGKSVAVDPTGAADVSEKHGRWTGPQISEAMGSPIIVGSHRKPARTCWMANR